MCHYITFDACGSIKNNNNNLSSCVILRICVYKLYNTRAPWICLMADGCQVLEFARVKLCWTHSQSLFDALTISKTNYVSFVASSKNLWMFKGIILKTITKLKRSYTTYIIYRSTYRSWSWFQSNAFWKSKTLNW